MCGWLRPRTLGLLSLFAQRKQTERNAPPDYATPPTHPTCLGPARTDAASLPRRCCRLHPAGAPPGFSQTRGVSGRFIRGDNNTHVAVLVRCAVKAVITLRSLCKEHGETRIRMVAPIRTVSYPWPSTEAG